MLLAWVPSAQSVCSRAASLVSKLLNGENVTDMKQQPQYYLSSSTDTPADGVLEDHLHFH